jgi:hypothetical protein
MSLLGKVRLVVFSKISLPFFHTFLTISLVIATVLAAVAVALAGHFTYLYKQNYGGTENFAVLAIAAGALALMTLPV